jgi:hypothetical protein
VSTDLIKPRFLLDEAATADFFGSHEPVANAIAHVIRTDPNLKVVGLLGAWGSGKSTVLKLLKTRLECFGNEKRDSRFFVYDAWVHQSDPPRRSFLETLIGFLVAEKLTTKTRWQDDLDRLNRRIEEHDTRSTPTLTFAGKFIAGTLLLFPIGLSLINPSWVGKSLEPFGIDLNISAITLGTLFLLAPALAGTIIYYSWRPNRAPTNRGFFRKKNFTEHRAPHESETILGTSNKDVFTARW